MLHSLPYQRLNFQKIQGRGSQAIQQKPKSLIFYAAWVQCCRILIWFLARCHQVKSCSRLSRAGMYFFLSQKLQLERRQNLKGVCPLALSHFVNGLPIFFFSSFLADSGKLTDFKSKHLLFLFFILFYSSLVQSVLFKITFKYHNSNLQKPNPILSFAGQHHSQLSKEPEHSVNQHFSNFRAYESLGDLVKMQIF